MTNVLARPPQVHGYHAHVYYDAKSRGLAVQLRESISDTFRLAVRDLRDEPIGPHLVPQFRFAFDPVQFDTVVPWLMLNRKGLDVLVHPLTDNPYDDHSRYVIWLGAPVALNLGTLRGSYSTEQYPVH